MKKMCNTKKKTRFSLNKIGLADTIHSAYSIEEFSALLSWLSQADEDGRYEGETARLVVTVTHYATRVGGRCYLADRHAVRLKRHIEAVDGPQGMRTPLGRRLFNDLNREDRDFVTGETIMEWRRATLTAESDA